MIRTARNQKEFWANVDKTGDCWLWTGTRNHQGYGTFYDGPRHVMAHRHAYEQTKGSIPPGMLVCHSCDTPSCVNPSHLWVGTQLENMRDAKNKGRTRMWHRMRSWKAFNRNC